MFNWEDLNLPEYDSIEGVKDRLDMIHAEEMKAKGLPSKPDHNSPGFKPGIAQSREVAVLSALGLEAKEIALALNVEEKLLKTYYSRELMVSQKISNAMVARKALEMAMSGRFPEMTKFWLKARAKWKETSGVEITGANGGPVEVSSAREKLARAMNLDADVVAAGVQAGLQ